MSHFVSRCTTLCELIPLCVEVGVNCEMLACVCVNVCDMCTCMRVYVW